MLSKLGKGAAGTILNMGGSCIPAWTATPTIGSTSWCNAGHAHAASNSGGTVCANVLAGTTLKSTVVTSSLETVGTLSALTVDDVAINGKVVTMTGSACDTIVMTAAANGAFSLVTTDTAAAAANITITADGTVDINSAGLLTLDSGAAINIEPAACSAILLDGTISIDAGVVTGATSITSTAFVGTIDGVLGGNTPAAITGTTLSVDNFTLNGTELDLSSGDFALDVAGDIEINADGGCINFKDASLALAAIVNTSCVGELRIHEAANYIGFKAPALSANQIWTLPAADGSACTVLTTDSCGVLSWAAAGGPCQASVAAIIAATNENTYIPPDLTPCIPGVSRTAVAHCNFSISSDNTLSDQACWDIAIATDEMVAISVTAFLYLTTAADFKYTFTGPSGMQMHTQGVLINRDTGAVVDAGFEATPGTAVPMIANADTCYVLRICGGFKADSSNAGTIAFQWAQNTSDGACIHFRRQSTFQATKAYFKAS